MKKSSYANLKVKLDIRDVGFQEAMAGRWDYITPWQKEPGGKGKYRFRLLRVASPAGGYVTTTVRFPGQYDCSTIAPFDVFFGKDVRWTKKHPFAQDALWHLRDRYFELISILSSLNH